jgi:hypothetical protein
LINKQTKAEDKFREIHPQSNVIELFKYSDEKNIGQMNYSIKNLDD